MPEIVIVDEIGTEAEALACRTIAERGVQLIGTAHGQMLENLIKNPTLSDLIGGHMLCDTGYAVIHRLYETSLFAQCQRCSGPMRCSQKTMSVQQSRRR